MSRIEYIQSITVKDPESVRKNLTRYGLFML